MIVNSTMKKSLKNSIDNGYKLKVSAVMNTVDSDTPISITPDDIQQNSFNIDRYVQTGNTFEIGSVCASELKFVLYNKDKFKGVTFEGAEIIVSGTIPVENSDGEWADTTVNLGSFTIDEKPKSQSLIQIVALDDMVKFDKPCTVSRTGTMSGLISSMASQCGVSVDEGSLNTCFNAYSDITVTLTLPADTDYLYRQVLSWLCQLALCNAYINVEGKLAFKNFTGSSVDTITADDRYTHTIEEKEIGVKELVYKDGETKETIVRWSGTTTRDKCISLDFSDNPMFKEFYTQLKENTTLFATWKSKVSSFYYVPFSANIRNFFWLEPMDKITFNKDGTNYNTWIMHTTLCPGSAMKLEAKGECKTKSGYASPNPLTAQEQKILNNLRKFVTAETAKVTPREYQLIEFNKAMNAGMAMYKSDVDGVTYYHDSSPIEASSYILVQNSEGIAWTDSGWNGGSPVWKYGLASDGKTILSSLDAYSIRADLITVTDLKAFGATIGGWNIGDEAIYKEVTERKNNGTYKYCAYIQSPYAVGDDTWVYSTQVYEPGSDGYRGTFYVTIKGDMHVQRIDSDKTIYTNCAEDDSIYGAIEHRRGGYYGAFGVSKDDDGTWYGASIQCRNSNRITSRLDVREGEVDGLVILETYQEGTDNKKYRSYLSFGNGYLCAGEVKYGSVNLLDFQAKDGHFQTIKTAGTGFAAIEHTRGSYMGSLGVGTSDDGENSVALQLRNSSAVLARLDVCDTAYSGCVTLQTTANSKYSYLTFFPDVIVAGKADNYDNTSAMLNFKANEIFATKVYQSSTESIKTNITAADSVLGLFEPENSQIYSYNLKKTVTTPIEGGGDGDVSTDGEGFEITEEVEETTSYGFVIGDGYAVPEQVLNKEGNAISLYSMAALMWKAVQELNSKIKQLEEKVNAQ